MKVQRLWLLNWLAVSAIILTCPAVADPVGAGFTYQGRLEQGGQPATGVFDFQFDLYDVETDGSELTDQLQFEDVSVLGGVFTVELDFGSAMSSSEQLWLEIRVREGASAGGFTGLLPRQKLNSSAYALVSRIAALEAKIDALEVLLAGVSRGTDLNTSQDTLTFTDMNVQVVNGTGTTDGATTGTGNLIIGYNELRDEAEYENYRDGSHMLVAGTRNNYTSDSFGGILVGDLNETSAEKASVLGGVSNTASGFGSTVSGGRSNTASNYYASVSGGNSNTASGNYASVSGGDTNTAGGYYASVSGGYGNISSGYYTSVSGGEDNQAILNFASVSGGHSNQATGQWASVSGGENNEASNNSSSVSGGELNLASGSGASVSGGAGNTASGIRTSVSGGLEKTAAAANCMVGDDGIDC
jgi:hypothetical protein